MKKLLISLAILIALSLCACTREPEGASVPPESSRVALPTTKTVYVHSAITQSYGSSTTRTEYLYDGSDRLTEVVIYIDDEESLRYSVTCDENDNPVRWVTTMEGAQSSIEYTYDNLGHTLGTYAYTNGNLMTATEYTWGNGLRVSVTAKAPSQNYERRTEYSYDENGVLFRQDLYINGTLNTYALCTADTEGRPVQCQSYTLDGLPTTAVTYTYDGATEKRTTTDQGGHVTQTQVLTYDESGNLLSSTVYDAQGNVLSAETHTWKAIQVPPDSPRAAV